MPINLASSPLTKLYLGNTEILKAYLGTIQVFPNFLLLDLYPSTAAFSLRKLRTAYSGSAVRVRRSSDNEEQNIGFNVNGGLDTTALNTFCTGANGFVTTWYNQQGSNNATQTTQANQPKIYDSVTGLVLEIDKPAVNFGFGGTYMYLDLTLTLGQTVSFFSVNEDATQDATSSLHKPILGSSTNNIFITNPQGYSLTKRREGTNGTNLCVPSNGSGSILIAYTKTGLQELLTATCNNGSAVLFKNGSQIGTLSEPAGSSTNTAYRIGAGDNTLARFYTGNIQELIIYNTDQSSNRTAIETNINTYYKIY